MFYAQVKHELRLMPGLTWVWKSVFAWALFDFPLVLMISSMR